MSRTLLKFLVYNLCLLKPFGPAHNADLGCGRRSGTISTSAASNTASWLAGSTKERNRCSSAKEPCTRCLPGIGCSRLICFQLCVPSREFSFALRVLHMFSMDQWGVGCSHLRLGCSGCFQCCFLKPRADFRRVPSLTGIGSACDRGRFEDAEVHSRHKATTCQRCGTATGAELPALRVRLQRRRHLLHRDAQDVLLPTAANHCDCRRGRARLKVYLA